MGSSKAILPGTIIFLCLGIVASIIFYIIAGRKTADPARKQES